MTRNLIREAARATLRRPRGPGHRQLQSRSVSLAALHVASPSAAPLRPQVHLGHSSCGLAPTISRFSTSTRTLKASSDAAKEGEPFVIKVPAGSTGPTPQQLLQESGHPSPSTFLAARASTGRLLSLHEPIPSGTESLTLLTFTSADDGGRQAFWLSSAYLLRAALLAEHSSALQLAGAVGAATQMGGSSGFTAQYLVAPNSQAAAEPSSTSPLQQAISLLSSLDASAAPLKDDQLAALEQRMTKLAQQKLPFVVREVSVDEARTIFASNPFKLEELEGNYGDGKAVRLVQVGELVDLAPSSADGSDFALLPTTKPIKAVKLLSCSTATWTPAKATAQRLPSVQALLYLRGIAFPTPAGLKSHLASLADAAARDHRTIAAAQQLFFTHDSSPGTPFILPRGMRVARKVERVVRDLYDVWGYDEVLTPQLYKPELWKRSGHWDNYRKDMFGVKGYHDVDGVGASMPEGREEDGCCAHGHEKQAAEDADKDSFGLKPMNCPGHCLIFNSQDRSYRDLPIRYAEFSPLHRNESSGSLSGLTRVRRFHQDDAHVFCRPDQVSSEISSMLSMLSSAYDTFGFTSFELVLSTRPPSYIGSLQEWDAAEEGLKEALEASGRKWSVNAEDGAFYGPKIDVRLVDAAGRKHQTATIQLDFQLPQRFGLKYAEPKAAPSDTTTTTSKAETLPPGYARPVMIHRAILGSVERFMAILIEQTMGRWPFWLSPRQAIVLPAGSSPEILAYARRIRNQLALGVDFVEPLHGPVVGKDRTSAPLQTTNKTRPSHVFHIDVDASDDTLAKRVRKAQVGRFNFILVVGENEAREGTVSVRGREDAEGQQEGGRPVIKKDMGAWKVQDLRELFVKLDSNHW